MSLKSLKVIQKDDVFSNESRISVTAARDKEDDMKLRQSEQLFGSFATPMSGTDHTASDTQISQRMLS